MSEHKPSRFAARVLEMQESLTSDQGSAETASIWRTEEEDGTVIAEEFHEIQRSWMAEWGLLGSRDPILVVGQGYSATLQVATDGLFTETEYWYATLVAN